MDALRSGLQDAMDDPTSVQDYVPFDSNSDVPTEKQT